MNRRGFLGSILALGAAPAIVRADSLMRVIPVDTAIIADEGLFVISSVTDTTITVAPLSTIDMITREAIRIAHEKTTFINSVNMGYTEGDVLKIKWPSKKQGDTIRIRTPSRYGH